MIITNSILINSKRAIKNQKTKQKYVGITVPLGFDTVHFGSDAYNNKTLSEDEANKRLTYSNRPEYDVDPVIVRKACMDKDHNIKENLVETAETLQHSDFSDKKVSRVVNFFKKDDGTIDNSVTKYLVEATHKLDKINNQDKKDDSVINIMKSLPQNIFPKKEKISDAAIDTIFAIENKNNNAKSITPLEFESTISDIKEYNLSPGVLGSIYSRCLKIPVIDNSLSPQVAMFIGPTLVVSKPEYEKPFKEYSKKFFEYTGKDKVDPSTYFSIMSNFLNPDASVNKPAMALSLELARKKVDAKAISGIVASTINPKDNSLDSAIVEFIRKVIDDGANKNADMSSLSLILSDITNILSLAEYRNISDPTYLGNLKAQYLNYVNMVYDSLPKIKEEHEHPEEFLNNVSAILCSSINVRTQEIDNQQVDEVNKLSKMKYKPGAIYNLFSASLAPDFTLNYDKLDKLVENQSKLTPEERKNIKSVDVNVQENVLKEATTYNSGKVSVKEINVFDSDSKMGEYDDNERVVSTPNDKITYTKVNDSIRGVRSKSISNENYPISDITLFHDPVTGEERIEYVSKSSIPGILDIRERDKNGNVKILSTGYKDKDSNTIVKSDFKSFDGTRTQINYKEAPNGSNVSDYVITDENGNNLLNEHKEFSVIDDNHFKSSINGHNYDMSIDKDHILTVTNDTKDNVSFDLDNFTGNEYPFFKNIIKHIPGNEFFNMKKAETRGMAHVKMDNAFYTAYNFMGFGDNYNKPSIFFHEFGHNKDAKFGLATMFGTIPISSCPKIINTNKNEMDLYTKHFPSIQRNYINYFMSGTSNISTDSAKKETVAETNSILNTPYQHMKDLAFRTIYLQRFFPKTIAVLAKDLNPDIYGSAPSSEDFD